MDRTLVAMIFLCLVVVWHILRLLGNWRPWNRDRKKINYGEPYKDKK